MNLSNKNRITLWVLVLIIIHTVGVIGLNNPTTQLVFQHLSELNLFISALVIFKFHEHKDKRLALFISLVFLIGMTIEVIGVKTGFPFGDYHYSSILKLQALEVPIIIGINWIVLTYCTAKIAHKFSNKLTPRILIGATVMVGLDVILEHFAVKHNLWAWEKIAYPEFENFIAWWVVALFTHLVYQKTIPNSENKIAVYYFIILTSFLFSDYILGKIL